MEPWKPTASLEEVGRAWKNGLPRLNAQLDKHLADPQLTPGDRVQALVFRASALHYGGNADRAYEVLAEARALAEAVPADAEAWLYSVVYYQGVTALRRGETVDLCPQDAASYGLHEGELVRVTSRRGSVVAPVRIDPGLRPGLGFMTMHFPDEVDTNVLTIDATDPRSDTAEFKAAAIRIDRIEAAAAEE